jgi:SAM-dependent methyltransferase
MRIHHHEEVRIIVTPAATPPDVGAAPTAPRSALHPPLCDLAAAVTQAHPFLERAASAKGHVYVNHEGGDVAGHGSRRSLLRHLTNYLAAAELAEHVGLSGRFVDVGSGVGALAAWLAHRLDASLHLVDRDPMIRRVASAAFPLARVHADLTELQPASASLVTAMEVVEHVDPLRQLSFVRTLYDRLAPGGLLVISTPDESGYLGGWSGYAPHIGSLDAGSMAALLERATGHPPVIWRLDGEPFHLDPTRRVLQPVANRLWGRVSRTAPALAHQAGRAVTALSSRIRGHRGIGSGAEVRAHPAHVGRGTGLLGVVQAAS